MTASFALPERDYVQRVARALINGSIRRDDLAAADRTGAPANALLIQVENNVFFLICHHNATKSKLIKKPQRHKDMEKKMKEH